PGPGTHAVVLRVVDDSQAEAVATVEVEVVAPPADVLATDTFTRSGPTWGAAEAGGGYAYPYGPAGSFRTTGTAGRIEVGTSGHVRQALLPDVTGPAEGTVTRATFSTATPAQAFGHPVFVVARRTATATEYRARLRLDPQGRAHLAVVR